MPSVHAANVDELYELRLSSGSGERIDERLRDRRDFALNWWRAGAEPDAEGRIRVLLVERSVWALAWVVGDGERFGRVVAPDVSEVPGIVQRFGLHASS